MKPREYIVEIERVETSDNHYELVQVATGINVERNEKVPVIEKSAYNQLLEQANKLAEALEWTAHTGSIPQGMSRKHEAKTALSSWLKFKKEQGLE